MKILFLGQLGIPAARMDSATSRGKRIAALAKPLVTQGHDVVVLGTKPTISGSVADWAGIHIVPRWSLNPERPGGWLYLLHSLWYLWRWKPDVAHFHSWKAAALVRLAAFLSPYTTYVWTVDALPRYSVRRAKFVAWQARPAFDAVTVPSRTLQYQLLTGFNLRAQYLPDGHTTSAVPAIPAKEWGLRKRNYTVALVDSYRQAKDIAHAYAAIGTKKQLVVVHTKRIHGLTRLNREYPFLRFVEAQAGRKLTSLLAQSSTIVLATPSLETEIALQSMAAEQPVIAVAAPPYQELLGTTGLFYAEQDMKELETLLAAVVKNPTRQKQLGTLSAQRAETHFTWERILPDYLRAYRCLRTRRVLIDSVYLAASRS